MKWLMAGVALGGLAYIIMDWWDREDPFLHKEETLVNMHAALNKAGFSVQHDTSHAQN